MVLEDPMAKEMEEEEQEQDVHVALLSNSSDVQNLDADTKNVRVNKISIVFICDHHCQHLFYFLLNHDYLAICFYSFYFYFYSYIDDETFYPTLGK